MKTYSRYIFIFVAILLPFQVLAEVSPETRVSDMLVKFKRSGSPKSLLPDVHWDTAYADFSTKVPKNSPIKITSASQYKSYVTELMEKPVPFLHKQAKSIVGRLKPQQQTMAHQFLPLLPALVQNNLVKMTKRIKATQYRVASSKIENDRALVEVHSSFNNRKFKYPVQLIKVEDKWMLASLNNKLMFGALFQQLKPYKNILKDPNFRAVLSQSNAPAPAALK